MIKYFSKYFSVSVVALLVDIAMMMFALKVALLSVFVATAIGYCGGAVISYFCSIRYVFNHRNYEERPVVEGTAYLISGVVGLAITEIVMVLGVDVFRFYPLLVKVVAVGVSFLAVYVLRYKWLFSKTPIKARGL